MTTTSTNDPLVGRVLDGRYEITTRIARGGMATVYVAHDNRLTRTVAVKVMHEGLGDDRDFARKFDREARAAARLVHPHVVAVFDQGHDAGRPYIVMEYVAGQTLRSVISRDAPLTPRRALDLMEPVLSALAAAHESGFVHRDVKPENVLISERGQVKVADFGLAKAISGDTVTATQGLLIGTVSYIPPELVAEGDADCHSDVYSAGIVLFELLTGRKPHTGDSPIQVAYAHCNKDVPAPSSVMQSDWRTDRDAIPPYLDALVQTATARDPKQRLRNGRVFLERLRVARHALEQDIMNDARLDAEMRRIDDDLDAPTQVLPGPDGAQPSRWVARPRPDRLLPSTPVSPVDIPAHAAVPFYDELPPAVKTPVERSLRLPPVVLAKPARAPRRPRGATATRRRAPRWRGLVALLFVLALAGGAGYGTWYALAGAWTNVPALAGQERAAAVAAATAAQLQLDVAEEYSEDVPAGVVIRTQPADGERVRANSTIDAFVSRGPERYAAPKLVGLERSLAEEAVRGASLQVGHVSDAFDDAVAAGIVLSASVEEGASLKKDTAVDLVVSKGPAPVDVPSLVGKPLDQARAALTKAGLKVAVTEDHSRTVPQGAVISQQPEGGQLHRGDTVSLVVSKGPVMVTVPNTRNMQEGPARAALEEKGFVVKVSQLPNPVPFGTVSYSDPAGGSQAPEGSTITIFVA